MGRRCHGGVSGRFIRGESALTSRGSSEPETRVSRRGGAQIQNVQYIERSRRRKAYSRVRTNGIPTRG